MGSVLRTQKPLMPKATAVWLIENTALTFEQIADFCNLHMLEVQHLADQEHPPVGFDPVSSGQISQEEIQRCEADSSAVLKPLMRETGRPGRKRSRYTPLIKRVNKPNAIAWMVKHYPHLPDTALKLFLGTTTLTIQSIRNKNHPHFAEIKPQSPVYFGFCTQDELETFLVRYDMEIKPIHTGDSSLAS